MGKKKNYNGDDNKKIQIYINDMPYPKRKNPPTEMSPINDISQAAISQNVKSLFIWSTCFFNTSHYFAGDPLCNNPAAAANVMMASFTPVNVNILHASAQSTAGLNKVTQMER